LMAWRVWNDEGLIYLEYIAILHLWREVVKPGVALLPFRSLHAEDRPT
jgi:hypothetical protein